MKKCFLIFTLLSIFALTACNLNDPDTTTTNTDQTQETSTDQTSPAP